MGILGVVMEEKKRCVFFSVTRFISLYLSHVQIKNKNKSLEFINMHWSIGFG